MNQEAMKARIEKAMERYEKERMRPRKTKLWSKINEGGLRVALREPMKTISTREAGND